MGVSVGAVSVAPTLGSAAGAALEAAEEPASAPPISTDAPPDPPYILTADFSSFANWASSLGSAEPLICNMRMRALICSIFCLAAALRCSWASLAAAVLRCFNVSTAERASRSLASARSCACFSRWTRPSARTLVMDVALDRFMTENLVCTA